MGRWLYLLSLLVVGCASRGASLSPTPDAASVIGEVATRAPALAQRLGWPTTIDSNGASGDRTSLRVTLPMRADGAWSVHHGARDSVRLQVTLEGAQPSVAEHVDGAVVYAGIHPHTDAVIRANGDQVELFYVLRGPNAGRRWLWRTEVDDASWRACDSGAELVDDDGRVRLHATRPIAFDHAGRRVAMSMRVAADTIEYALVGGAQIAWPVVVDPGFDVAYWERRYDSEPVAAALSSIVYDEAMEATLLFGGAARDGMLDDTWSWDGTRWERLMPATRPTPASGVALVHAFGATWMFGGFGEGNVEQREFWRWDGTDWTLVVRDVEPGPFGRSAMAFDPVTHRVLLFGERDDGDGDIATLHTETWTWDGSAWAQQVTAHTPGRTSQYSMVFDPVSGDALLTTIGAAGGTWRWDGVDWSLASPSDGGHQAARLVVRDGLVRSVSLGDPNASPLATWTGSGWRIDGPNARFSTPNNLPNAVYDSRRDRIVLLRSGNQTTQAPHDLYEFDGIHWALRSPSLAGLTVPSFVLPPRDGHLALAENGVVQIWHDDHFEFGGGLGVGADCSVASSGADAYAVCLDGSGNAAVHLFHEGAWSTLGASAFSGGRVVALAAHEALGGLVATCADGAVLTWNGTWTREIGPVAASSIYDRTVAYDAVTREVLLRSGPGSVPGSTWGWGGTAWREAIEAPCCGMLVRGALGRVWSIDATSTLEHATDGWTRIGDGVLGLRVATGGVDPASGEVILVGRDARVRAPLVWRAPRWLDRPLQIDVPSTGEEYAVASDPDSGRFVTARLLGGHMDNGWVGPSYSGGIFDGTRFLGRGYSVMYAGPSRGVLVTDTGAALWSATSLVEVDAPPAAVGSGAFDRVHDVVVAPNATATLEWSELTGWTAYAATVGATTFVMDPVSGMVVGQGAGGLRRWERPNWVSVGGPAEVPSGTLTSHGGRGSLVIVNRDGVWERSDDEWMVRDARGTVPSTPPRVLAYHAPLDAILGDRWSLRLLSDVGVECVDAADCGGGFCVDGVCCSDPCGGGVADCMACSVSAGGGRDGDCTALRAGLAETIECRAGLSACDAAEMCSPSSPRCPGDGVVADGTACLDGLACNGEEACRSGACVSPSELCDDGDGCTADGCTEPGRCLHVAVAGCCRVDGDCTDGDSCTHDACLENACVHEPSCFDAGVEAIDGGRVDGGRRDGGGTPTELDASADVGDGGEADAGEVLDAQPGGLAGGAGCDCRAGRAGSGPLGLFVVGGLLAMLGARHRMLRR